MTDQPTEGTTPKQPSEPRRERAKAFGKDWIIGMIVLSLFSIIGHVGNSIGVQELNIKTLSSPSDLITAITQLTWQQGLFVLFTVAGVGAVTFLFVSSQVGVGKLVRLHRDSIIPNQDLNDQIKKDIKKMRIIPLFVWIGLVALIVVPVAAGINSIQGIVGTNYHDKFTGLIVSYIVTAITVAIGGAVTGWLMIRLKKWYYGIYDRIEPYLQKSRVF